MSNNVEPLFFADGNINPSCFVKMSTTQDNRVLQAAANTDKIIGISQVGTRDPQGLSGASAVAAAQGDPIKVYSQGDVCSLVAGSGGWTRGDWLVSDANGNGVTAPTSGVGTIYVGAIALESAAASAQGRVVVFLDAATAGSQVDYSQALTPVAIAANTSAEQTFTVTGLVAGQRVLVTPPAAGTAGTIMGPARASATDTLAITFGNFTGGSLTPAAGTYKITVLP